jgi:hypothetical protein
MVTVTDVVEDGSCGEAPEVVVDVSYETPSGASATVSDYVDTGAVTLTGPDDGLYVEYVERTPPIAAAAVVMFLGVVGWAAIGMAILGLVRILSAIGG